MPDSRDFDLTLYGASGFTGRQTAAYVKAHASPSLRWAIAGRDEKKLATLKLNLRLPADVGLVVAESQDRSAVERMVRNTRVLLTTAGPFALSGEPIVSACVQSQTDYLDITGETAWVRDMIDRYHEKATSARVRIVHFCGFDSVPSDLGTLLVVLALRRHGLACREVKAFFTTSGSVNRGTVASVQNIHRSGEAVRMRDPFLLVPEKSGRTTSRNCLDPVTPVYDSDLRAWVGPFAMGPINTRVVRRSAALAHLWKGEYGPDFSYQEFVDVGGPAPWLGASLMATSLALYQFYSRMPGAAEISEKLLPITNPTERQMDEGYYRCRFVGTGTDGSKVWAIIEDRGDPGNRGTVKMVCEAAFALVSQRQDLPGGPARGGVLTPATALGMTLVNRLRCAGVRMEVENFGRS